MAPYRQTATASPPLGYFGLPISSDGWGNVTCSKGVSFWFLIHRHITKTVSVQAPRTLQKPPSIAVPKQTLIRGTEDGVPFQQHYPDTFATLSWIRLDHSAGQWNHSLLPIVELLDTPS